MGIVNTKQNQMRSMQIRWGITLCVFACTVFLTYNRLSLPEVYFCGITSLALCIWALEILPENAVAVVLPGLYVLFGVATPKSAFSSWTTTVGWVMFGGLVLGAMMARTGLAKRIALKATKALGGSFTRVLWGILLGGMILAPFIPSVMGKAAIISVICIGICDALGIQKGTKESSAVILTGFISVAAPKMAYVTGGADILLSMNQVASTLKTSPITWGTYLQHNFPLATLYAIISLMTLIFVLRPKLDKDVKSIVEEQYNSLGKISTQEIKVAAILVGLLVLMLTDSWHGIEIGWLMLVVPFLGFLPGFSVLDKDGFAKLPLPAVFFVVGCMSIGSAAMSCGIDKTLSAAMLPLLQGSEMYSVAMSFFSGVVLNFLLTPLAAVSTFTVPLVDISAQLGINPYIMIYAFNYGIEQYLFPYEYAVLLFFASFGYTKLSHIIQVFGVRMLLAGVLVPTLFYSYWKYLL